LDADFGVDLDDCRRDVAIHVQLLGKIPLDQVQGHLRLLTFLCVLPVVIGGRHQGRHQER
jgi:hypothetical protein